MVVVLVGILVGTAAGGTFEGDRGNHAEREEEGGKVKDG